MDYPVLPTKLHMPALRPSLVSRPQLIHKLSQRPQGKLTLVSAPAGSGKTTLICQFVSRLARPFAWLSLDEADNDISRFWRYLIAACQTVQKEVGATLLPLLETAQSLPADTIPSLLVNDIIDQACRCALVLDDYHLIQNLSIHQGVATLLDYLPPEMHIIVSTRVDPPWPLARYRVRNQLTEIRAQDLRFSQEETEAFFNLTMDLNLSAEAAAALARRTEGWAAGLQLAALALQAQPAPEQEMDRAAFIQNFTGSHRYIAEYLIDEIFRQQAADVQTFLLQTAVLERLHPQLCDAVCGRQDSSQMLAALHRANLFVIPLDAAGQWFRYHHLFADLLRARLPQHFSEEEIASLHKRAAAWYQGHELPHEAINHTLAVDDFEGVARLVEQEARPMMFSGQASTLSRWLDALPETAVQAHPRLQVYRLWLDLMQEKVALSPRVLREKENLLSALPPTPENEKLQVELTAVLCRFFAFAGDTARALRLAEEALSHLAEEDKMLRARAHSALAIAYWVNGDTEKAKRAYEQCLALALASGNYSLAAHATMMRATEQADYGQLHAAATSYQSIVDMGLPAGQKIFFPAGQGYIGLAGIHLEWNDLETALNYLQQGMALCRQGGLAGLSAGHTIQARLQQAQGNLQAALKEIDLAGETGTDPTQTARQILLRVAVGDLDGASRLAAPWANIRQHGKDGLQPPPLVLEIIKITLARLYLAIGELPQAEQLLAEVEATAAPAQRNGRLIELFLGRALLRLAQHPDAVSDEAVAAFNRALALARPEGYTLLFLEGGTAVQALLQAASQDATTSDPLKQYAEQLLEAFLGYGNAATPPASGEAAGLVELLTPREMEVLQLVSAGDSNQVIADKLVITVRTVKKHITNILGKLGASNRTQAVARARALGLISSE